MSTLLTIIQKTGRDEVDLDITEFSGGKNKKLMIQLTQGVGGFETSGFIQLTQEDAIKTISAISKWLKKIEKDEK